MEFAELMWTTNFHSRTKTFNRYEMLSVKEKSLLIDMDSASNCNKINLLYCFCYWSTFCICQTTFLISDPIWKIHDIGGKLLICLFSLAHLKDFRTQFQQMFHCSSSFAQYFIERFTGLIARYLFDIWKKLNRLHYQLNHFVYKTSKNRLVNLKNINLHIDSYAERIEKLEKSYDIEAFNFDWNFRNFCTRLVSCPGT